MEASKNLNKKIKEIFGKNQSRTSAFILLLGCIGMLLIVLSEFIPDNLSESKNIAANCNFSNTATKESELESRLKDVISQISGAGKTVVMVTLDSSEEYFYAKNSSEDKDDTETKKESEIVIIDGENGEEPIILKSTEAEVRGVLVICEGGENAVVREKIIEAVCALLDVPSNRVSVAKMA